MLVHFQLLNAIPNLPSTTIIIRRLSKVVLVVVSNDSSSLPAVILPLLHGYIEKYFCISHQHCQSRHYQAFSNFVFSKHRVMGLQKTYRPTVLVMILLLLSTIIIIYIGMPLLIQYTYDHLERILSTQYIILNPYLLQLTKNYPHDDHDVDQQQ
jgi:hypothetical protein